MKARKQIINQLGDRIYDGIVCNQINSKLWDQLYEWIYWQLEGQLWEPIGKQLYYELHELLDLSGVEDEGIIFEQDIGDR